MIRFQLSHRAEDDFLEILTFTLRTWGEAQAEQYLNRIESCCELLVKNPQLGRSCEWIAEGLRRVEEGRHVIFYRQDLNTLKIVRILHKNMIPLQHMMEDEPKQ